MEDSSNYDGISPSSLYERSSMQKLNDKMRKELNKMREERNEVHYNPYDYEAYIKLSKLHSDLRKTEAYKKGEIVIYGGIKKQ